MPVKRDEKVRRGEVIAKGQPGELVAGKDEISAQVGDRQGCERHRRKQPVSSRPFAAVRAPATGAHARRETDFITVSGVDRVAAPTADYRQYPPSGVPPMRAGRNSKRYMLVPVRFSPHAGLRPASVPTSPRIFAARVLRVHIHQPSARPRRSDLRPTRAARREVVIGYIAFARISSVLGALHVNSRGGGASGPRSASRPLALQPHRELLTRAVAHLVGEPPAQLPRPRGVATLPAPIPASGSRSIGRPAPLT